LFDVKVNILGVGNTLMGDDGVGPAAVERLAARGVPAHVRLHDAGLAASDVLGRLDPDDPLIVIDAVCAGGPAGAVYQVDVDASAAESLPGTAISLHELSVAPALAMEALTGRVFSNVTVFGVEPARVAWGEGLSPAVASVLDRLVDAVLDHARAPGPCRALAGEESP
jgi:hydrogenase maturation protease